MKSKPFDTFGGSLSQVTVPAPLGFVFDFVTRCGRNNLDSLRRLFPEFMAEDDATQAFAPNESKIPCLKK